MRNRLGSYWRRLQDKGVRAAASLPRSLALPLSALSASANASGANLAKQQAGARAWEQTAGSLATPPTPASALPPPPAGDHYAAAGHTEGPPELLQGAEPGTAQGAGLEGRLLEAGLGGQSMGRAVLLAIAGAIWSQQQVGQVAKEGGKEGRGSWGARLRSKL